MVDDQLQVSERLRAHYVEYYDESILEWRRVCAKYKARNIVDLSGAVPHETVVDIGAGEGSVSAELARLGFSSQIHCLEMSDSALEFIRAQQVPGIVSVEQMDGVRIPYGDKHFDLAMASHVLEHVEHERAFLYEAARVAKHLYIEVPLEDTFRAADGFTSNEEGHINFYNKKTIRKLVETSGLEVIDLRLFDIPYEAQTFHSRLKGSIKFGIRRAFGLFGLGMASRLFTYHCGVLCRT